MKSKPQNRRAFLLAGVGGTGAAVAAVALRKQPEGVTEAAAAPTGERDGYRETEHIQKYYKTTKV
jgi:hypothetical protein